MNFAMEFHDSRLLDLRCGPDGQGFALFNAYVYRSSGLPFEDAQESGWQRVRFSFEGMRVEGTIVAFGEYASDGDFWVDGQRFGSGVANLPADHYGALRMELSLSPTFETITIHAVRSTSSFESEFEIEAIWDAKGDRKSVRG